MANFKDYAAARANPKAQNPALQGGRGGGSKPLAEVNSGLGKADNWAQRQLNSDTANQTPLLTNAGKESYNLGAGTARAIGGIASGDWGQAKSGLKQAGSSVLSALTLGSLRGLNQAPPQQFLGGSPEALAQRQGMYQTGVVQGNTLLGAGLTSADTGLGMLGQAGTQAVQDRGMGYALAGGGLATQYGALDAARGMAARPTDSLAQLQMQQGLAQAQQGMLGQAAQARGGNQAAAIRNAQLQGSNMALQTNAQAAQLRAAEQQAQINRQLGVEQMAAQMGGQQLGLGMSTAQQGTAQLGQFGGQVGSVGLGQAQLGLGSQGQYLNALTGTDKEQLQADTQYASAKKASQGGIMGVAGKVIGSLFG